MSIQALNLAPKKQSYPSLFQGALAKTKPEESSEIKAGITFRQPLDMDLFEKSIYPVSSENKPSGSLSSASGYGSGDTHSGETLKTTLDDLNFFNRKIAAHYFVKKASPIEFKQPILDDYRLEPKVKAQLVDIAENLELMSKAEKVEFMRDMTGASSNFARYAEKVLIQDANPSIKETLNLFKPKVQEQSIQGYKDAFSAMGVGLMMMPLLMGGNFLFNPNLLGRFIAGMGIALA